MFKARVILREADIGPRLAQLETIALACGLDADATSKGDSAATRSWRTGNADAAPVTAMHVTEDHDLACAYVEIVGHHREALANAVARIYATLPVCMPTELVNDAVAAWRQRPNLLQCAALAVTDETATTLATAISEALRDSDTEAWRRAASAAALMPPEIAKRIVSQALVTESLPERMNALKQLQKYLNGSPRENAC
ncbi:MAG TPA: hypothetical protein VLI06_03305 [Solimonas sp.]|nr:hypothetical protein [Solimonas sp.]